ncbi:MAG: hypothetical protein ACQERS_10155 [Bacteroidota bacterium]
MRKILVLLTAITITVAAHSQVSEVALIEKYSDKLVNDLIKRTGGYLQNDTIVSLDEGGYAKNTVLGLPDSHDFDLLRKEVRMLARDSREITVVSRWQEGYDNIYDIELKLPGNMAVIIYYSNKVKTIMVTVTRR